MAPHPFRIERGYRPGKSSKDPLRTWSDFWKERPRKHPASAASHVTPLLGVDTPPEQIVAAARAYLCNAVGMAIMPRADLQKVAARLQWMLAELSRCVPL